MGRIFNVPRCLRVFRAGALIVLIVLVHQQARWLQSQQGTAISLKRARKFFPTANHVQLRDIDRGLYFVTDARGNTIGCLLTTSPQTDNIIGYSGPSDLLIALDNGGAIAGFELLQSGDTREHVERVKRDAGFFRRFLGWRPAESPPPKISGVSGATLTSYALAESIQQRLAGATPSLRFPDPVTLTEVQNLFTNAVRIVPEEARWQVLDGNSRLLGYALRTSPQADNVPGFRGPTECLAGISIDGRTIVGLRLRKSYDTESYVDTVRRDQRFLKQFAGRSVDELASLDRRRDRIEGVSGASLTTRAITEGLKRRLALELKSQGKTPAWRPSPRDWGLAAVILGALTMSFTSLRGTGWARVTWQLLLIGYVGLVNHDLLSLSLLGGWAANGLALKALPGLVLLAAAAVMVPLGTRRQIYCHQICPHGAAQQLLGKISRYRWSPPAKVAHALEYLPGTLLCFALLTLLFGWKINLAGLEPFDAWAWRTAGIASIIIAATGLLASLVIPQAYCHFGCPTGALLGFVRSKGSADHWGGRDWTALALLAAAFFCVIGVRAWPHHEPEPEPLALHGRTMGTAWTVKIRDEIADSSAIEKAIAAEFEWAEAMTSNWRTNTDLSIFNRTPSTDPMPVPWPVLTLARWAAEISTASGGAYDITVGSLVKLWGFGPAPRRAQPPTDAEIAATMPSVGWKKLELLDGMLRKQNPGLEVDFSSIAKGWAVEQVADVLVRRGYTNFLISCSGDLRARGRWAIVIEHPTRTCVLNNEAISTSGTYRQNYKSGAREYSHLIDARTGRPITHPTVSASVRADDGGHADGWSTAMNVLGADAGLALAEHLHLAVQFVVESGNGKFDVRQSSAWTARDAVNGIDAKGKPLPPVKDQNQKKTNASPRR